METHEFIKALPKAEVHLHLEGAVPWHMIRAASPVPLPETPEWWAPEYRIATWEEFSDLMRLSIGLSTNVETYHQVAKHIFHDLAAQNVRFVEISFGSFAMWRLGLDCTDLVAAIKEAAPEGLTVSVFCGISRMAVGAPPDEQQMQLIFNAKNLDGLDLHGDERTNSTRPYAHIFEQARQHGLLTRAHAGELAGPHSIVDALDHLKVKRIEHGTTAIHDEALITRLADEGIALDMCPMSNVRLNVVESIEAHPIKQFMQRGIPVTVSTDDPTIFGYSLTEELLILAERLNFTHRELADLQINAFRSANMPDTQRSALIAEVEALVSQP